MRIAALAFVLLAACSEPVAEAPDAAGPALESAAVVRGLVADPDVVALTGLFARDADRLCLREREDARAVVGISIDYGAGNGCSARGTVQRRDGGLTLDFGEACRFDAEYDGEVVRFPGALPDGCADVCRGNASLAGMATERLSHSSGEVAAFRDRRGRFPCADDATPPS